MTNDDKMNGSRKLAMSDDIGVALMELLGIEKESCVSVDIKIRPCEPIIVEAKYHARDYSDPEWTDLETKIKKYELVERDE